MDAETDANATDAGAGSTPDREEEAEEGRRRRRLAVDVDVGAFVHWRTGGAPVKTPGTEASGDVDGDVDGGGDAVGRRLDADAADFASWRVGGVASPCPETPSIVGMETREEIDERRACLLTTRFERTGTPLDGVTSHRELWALSCRRARVCAGRFGRARVPRCRTRTCGATVRR